MDRSDTVDLDFRLSSPEARVEVCVRLRGVSGRWVARADLEGSISHALGASPREALSAVLEPLGRRAVAALLADIALLAPSCELLRQQEAAV